LLGDDSVAKKAVTQAIGRGTTMPVISRQACYAPNLIASSLIGLPPIPWLGVPLPLLFGSALRLDYARPAPVCW
jgi:hypothetical protein